MEYEELAEDALSLIEDAGRVVTLKRITPGAYHPDDDARSADLEDETEITAVFTHYRSHEIDGEIIRRNDKRVLIAAESLTSEPDGTCWIIDGATKFKVIDTVTVQPGDTPLLYKVQVRK